MIYFDHNATTSIHPEVLEAMMPFLTSQQGNPSSNHSFGRHVHTAIEEATYLAKICSKVSMLVRKDHFRASKAMQNRLANFDNIEVLFNHEIEEVIGETVVEGIKIKNNLNSEESVLKITGLFIAIGHTPNTDIFKGLVEMDDSGYIITDKTSTKTNIHGVFAAGDVQDKDYRQAVTAAGTGCMAALDAERYLASSS